MAKDRNPPQTPRAMRQKLIPFLKWAGGKRWLFESGQFSAPSFHGRYFEPFLGGGAAFFQIQPASPILSDFNSRLIELYVAVRDDLKEFEAQLTRHAKFHSRDYYYEVRGQKPEEATARAAQFLYLNRTCWNGLYRENLKGEFNVPIGSKETVIFPSDDFSEWSRSLMGAEIVSADFEESIDRANAGDFLFVDPPYTVRHNSNGFVKYNKKMFSWEDQVRLRDALERATRRGASFALTNANHNCIRDLYCGLGHKRVLHRHTVIAGCSAYRSQSTEILITN